MDPAAAATAFFSAILAGDRRGLAGVLDGVSRQDRGAFSRLVMPGLEDFYTRILFPVGTPGSFTLFADAMLALTAGLPPEGRARVEHLLSTVHVHAGNHRQAMDILERAENAIEEACRREPLCADGARFVSHEPVLARIGDGALNLGLRVLAQRLGWCEPHRWVGVCPPGEPVSNRTYLKLWAPEITIIEDPEEAARLSDRIAPLRRHCGYLRTPARGFDQPDFNAPLAYGAWHLKHGGNPPPLVALPEETREDCARRLEELGLPGGAWWVAVHVREPGIHRYDGKGLMDWRFHDPAVYDGAIDAIIRRGGWAVRVGHCKQPLRPRPGLIDYGIDPEARSEAMDLYLIEGARFLIGGSSGLARVASTFGTPVLGTHHLPLAPFPGTPRDMYVPLRFVRKEDGRPLPVAQVLAPPLAFNTTLVWLDRMGLALTGSSGEEVAIATGQFLDRLEGRLNLDGRTEAAIRRLEALGGYGDLGIPLPLVAPIALRNFPDLF